MKHCRKSKKHSLFYEHEFTILELLIVIALIMILASMLLPALNNAKARAKEIACIGNLRQDGTGFSMYASDFNSIIILNLYKTAGAPYAKGGSSTWIQSLDGTWDLEYLKNRDVAVCPSFAPRKYYNLGRIYGANPCSPRTLSAELPPPAGYETAAMINLTKLVAPTTYYLLVDSYNPAWNEQVYLIYQSPAPGSIGIHLRHAQKANMLFADGHVAGHTKSNIRKFNIYKGYSAEGLQQTY